MDKELGQEYPEGIPRENFLRDNCDAIEMLDYTKPLTGERREELKESITEKSIQLKDVRADKRAADKEYKEQDRQRKEQMKQLCDEIDNAADTLQKKAEYVSENCYKIIYEEERTVAYYDKQGKLAYSRPARPDEMQTTIQMQMRRTGTEG